MQRRDFLKTLGVASTASLTTSCGLNKSTEKLIPYLVPPEEEIIPGTAIYRATSCSECSSGCGVTARIREKVVDLSHVRVPVKLEGTDSHPVNDGALCIRGQSAITRLYHPDRIQTPLVRDASGNLASVSWDEAFNKIMEGIDASELDRSRNVYLTGHRTGSLAALTDDFCIKMGIEKLPAYELFPHANLRQAHKNLFNLDEIPSYRIADADFLLTVGADIFGTFVSPVSYAKQFAQCQKKDDFTFYHVEAHASTTGFRADHRLKVKPDSEVYLLLYLLANVEGSNAIPGSIASALPQVSLEQAAQMTGLEAGRISDLLAAFKEAQNPLIIAGGVGTSGANGLACAMAAGLIQWTTGMIGSVVDFSRSMDYSGVGAARDMANLTQRLDNGDIGVVFLSDINPAATLPDGSGFVASLRKAKFRVGFAHLLNDTMNECDVVLPLSHGLESWGDQEPMAGLSNLMQPALEPLYDTMTEGDILLQISLRKIGVSEEPTFQEYVLKRWQRRFGRNRVAQALDSGYIEAAPPGKRVTLGVRAAANAITQWQLADPAAGTTLVVTPSLRTYDGRGRELQLLHEIPDALSGVSYGSWVSISKAMAARMELADNHEIRISTGSWETRLPVRLQAGLPDDVMMVQRDVLQDFPAAPAGGDFVSYLSGVQVEKTGSWIAFPILTGQSLEHEVAAERYDHAEGGGHGEAAGSHGDGEVPQMYEFHTHKQYRWAMAIDLDLCTGCSACVAACYTENNIAMTGPEQHLLGREMAWIRIEPRYDSAERLTFQPVMCQHCGNAPCEPVCPVFATNHSEDGLNAQIYNRCVGTRYCSNNCPYKVRRFNWFEPQWEGPLNLMMNPDLSHRGVGVMEKCTFCVQRIRSAKDNAKDEDRLVRDGEIRTACEQTCPTNAIVFGNLLDPESEVARLSALDRGVLELEELNTKPAVTYLKKTES